MNLKKLFLMLTFFVLLGTTAFAQNTIYVDVTNGSDTYSGVNETNNPAGTGPKASFAAGVAALANSANGGTIILKAGTYAEALDFTTGLPANVTSYTVQLKQLNANDVVAFTGGASVINKTGLTVSITTTIGTEKITQTSTTLNMTLGTINLGTSTAWVLPTNTTINLAGTSGFANAAPAKTTDINLNYTGGSTITAGQESNYGSFGAGTITVNKTAGTGVTFPYAISAIGGITITSGNATFSGAVAVAAGATDVVNNGTGTLTFDGALSLGITSGAVADANIASIINTSSGSVVANSTTTWTVPATLAAAAFAQAAATDGILNSGTGSLLLNGAVTLNAPNNTTGNDYSFYAENTSTGTLTIGALSTPSSGAAFYEGTLNLAGAATAGTINIGGGTYANVVSVAAGHRLNVNGATTVGGIFTNAGTTALGANALTLSGNVAHVTVGGTVTSTAPGGIFVTSTGAGVSFNGGTLGNLTNNGAGNTVTLSAVTNFTNLTATAGTITVGAATTITGTLTLNGGNVTDGNFLITVNNYEQSAGTFTLAANAASILDVNGNFNRTGGTFTAGAASLVSFTGSGAQAVNGGPLFQVSTLTFNNAGGLITVGNSIRASGTITIATATNVDFSTTNLIMNGTTNGIINNGTYTAIGGGGVVVGGINTVTGGVAGAGAGVTYTIEGTGTYSYITIDVGAANLAEVVTTVTGVKWNGVLTLRSGTLDVATAGVDFGPTGTNASIVRYPEDSPGITTSAGTFNAANVTYDLTYKGTLTADKAVGSELTATPANVRTWTVETTGGVFNNDLPANGLNFGGTLIIEDGAYVRIPTDGGGADYFTLSGASKNHVIRGTFDIQAGDADALVVSGSGSTLTGSATVAHAATIDNVEFNSTDIVVTNIQAFSGTVKTGAGSTVTLGMGAAAAEQQVAGLLTAGGTTLTLTTPLVLNAGVAHTAGTIDLGANTVKLATAGNWLQTGGTVTSTGGYVQFDVNATLTLTSAMPYLRVNEVTVTLGSNITVSQNLDIIDATAGAPIGTITSAGFNTTIQNSMTTAGGAIYTGAGAIVLAGTTVTASGDPTIANLTVNSTGIATLASTSATVARTFTVPGVLTHTAGELALGMNHVALTGAGAVYTRAAGTITATTGELQFNGTAAQSAAQGTGFSIPNLTINNTTGAVAAPWDVAFAGAATSDFVVTGTLKLTQGVFYTNATAGKLHLGDNATIVRNAALGSLVQVPTFDGDVNLSYVTGSGVMGNEVPTVASAKLKNVTINPGGGNTITTAVATAFKGTATLTSGTWSNAGGAITAASGATIVKNAGVFNAAPTVTNYNLTYTSTQVTTTNEFINGAGISVDLLTINGAGITVTLGQNRTVKDFTITAGTFNDGAFTLTVTGNMDLAAGTYTGTGALSLSGTTAQTIKVPAAGLNFGGNLTLNNAAGFTLDGGNFTMGAGKVVTFTAGVLSTGSNIFTLAHAATGQGFARTSGHIAGNVRHAITAGAGSPTVYANGRYEFPVGTTTDYRPFAITFTSTYPAINPTNVTVNMVDVSPEGVKNLPITADTNLKIGNYPNYYWLVKTFPSSFTSTQNFDVEMHGTNLGYPYDSDQNLRIIRRQDGSSESNGWAMQGANANYANYQVVNGADTLAVVRTTSSIGGIVNEGTRFSIGIPTRAPSFVTPTLAVSVNEGATSTTTYTANANDVGETVSYSLVGAPSWATIDATTGVLTLAPDYSVGSATPYNIVVKATDTGGASSTITVAVTVVNVNRGPSFTATGAQVHPTATVKAGETLSLTYVAVDADGGTPTYSYVVAPTPAGTAAFAANVFTFAPTFADAGKDFTFSIIASDGTDADTAATVVTVNYQFNKGDVNKTGTVTSADATPILEYVVGKITLTADQLYYADVNSDGVVGALDAAWVLYYAVNGSWPTSAKAIAASGALEFGQFGSENGEFTLPIKLAKTNGVLSVYTEVQLGNGVEFKGVSSRLPEGWVTSSNFENGVLKLAMAGIEPLREGAIAVVNLALVNKEAVVTVEGNAKLNDYVDSPLQSVKVREIPTEFALSQNFPNPFNPTTSIKYSIAQNANVQLVVYNMLGQVVKTLVNGEQEAGYYTIQWNGTNDFGGKVASGIYIYRIVAGDFTKTIKMNFLK